MAEPAPLQPSKGRTAGETARLARCGAVALMAISFLPGLAAQAGPSQYKLEAAYLLDFGRFTRLPANSQALRRRTFDVCIVGRGPIGKSIDKLAVNDAVDHRAVRVLHNISPSQARTCAMAFISAPDDDAIRDDLTFLSGADVLTVGDSPKFLEDGGMIQFVIDKNQVRFAVNLDAVRKTHLVLSSQLLRVALYVKDEPQPEAGR